MILKNFVFKSNKNNEIVILGFVGALAYTFFSDSFGIVVEAEVYAGFLVIALLFLAGITLGTEDME
jgi:hypothetical protein